MASTRRYIWVLRWPIVLTFVNSSLGGIVFDWPMGDVAFNLTRLAILIYAASLLIAGGFTSLWVASLAGLLLFFIDHPVIRGGSFLIAGERKAFYGVLLSFALFVAVPMALSALAAYLFRRRLRRVAI